MHLTFEQRGLLHFEEARIVHRNFSGAGSTYNREGDINFSVVIDTEEQMAALVEQGWNVKEKPPKVDGEEPFRFLPIKVKFNDRGPNVYLVTGEKYNKLDEDSIDTLDDVDIANVDLIVRPYDWELRDGKSGRTAYLQSMEVVQRFDPIAAKYEQ